MLEEDNCDDVRKLEKAKDERLLLLKLRFSRKAFL